MGSGHRNETHWVGSQVEKAYDMVKSKECCHGTNLSNYEFLFVEHRYDEPLTLAFGLKYYPSIYVIAPDTGMVYQWDKYQYIDNQTFADFLFNKTYLNSSVFFPAPRYTFESEYQKIYITRWFQQNFG